MSKFQNKYRIESSRLKHWDYSTPWWYYVTIVTKEHINYFGKIENGKMYLSELGKFCRKCWNEIPIHYPDIELDYYIIMPNHIHGIIILNENARRDVACNVSTNTVKNNNKTKNLYFSKISPKANSLSVIVRSFKSAVTRYSSKNDFKDFKWQPRFYDRIIRNEKELFQIRKYIEQNPIKWEIEKNIINNL